MRNLLPVLLLIAPAGLPAQPLPQAASGGNRFLSPMGEPFRSQDPAGDNIGTWFALADGDRDGAITLAELQLDAARFFALLDSDSNGELAMAEIGRYENEVAPEVQVGLQMRTTGFGDWRGNRRRRILVYEKGIEGGGRFSFLNIPHPVMAADMDMNRGVSRDEFAQAAAERFGLLDKDRDGRLTRTELPPLPQAKARRPGSDEGPRRPFQRTR